MRSVQMGYIDGPKLGGMYAVCQQTPSGAGLRAGLIIRLDCRRAEGRAEI